LAANLLPAVFAAGSSACILLYHKSSALLPAIAILSQILTFAVALVARVKLISDDLSNKAIEAMQLEADITITEYKRMLIEQENKHISKTIALEKERNELLQQKLEENQRELVGNSLYIHQKNKLLADLKTQMRDMDTLLSGCQAPKFLRIYNRH
jgi:septal ring factor EnvC (AmiA/AmiB activator)